MAGRERQGRISGVTSTRRLPSRSGWQTAGIIRGGVTHTLETVSGISAGKLASRQPIGVWANIGEGAPWHQT
jgi:hypothetical protein